MKIRFVSFEVFLCFVFISCSNGNKCDYIDNSKKSFNAINEIVLAKDENKMLAIAKEYLGWARANNCAVHDFLGELRESTIINDKIFDKDLMEKLAIECSRKWIFKNDYSCYLYSLNFNYQNDSNSSFNDLLSSCNENDFLLSCYSAETIYLNFKSSDLKISDTLANLESYCDRNEYYSCLAVTKVLDFIDKQTKSDSELNKEEANSRYKELEKLKLPFRIKACDGGLALACSDLAVYYQVETMGKKFISSNPGLAWTKYELYAVRACEYGHVGQCSFVGSFLLNGHTTTVYINEDDETGQELHAIRKNPELAFKMFNISCNARQKLECNSLGWMYERGIFIDKDVSKAQELYTIACEKDYYGCFNLGALLMRKGNYNDAEQYFIKALQITQDNNSEVYKITRSALFDIYKEKNDRLNANKYAEISCDLSSVDACKYIVLNNISPDGTKINPLGLVYLFKACKLRDENSCELLEIHLNYLCAVGNSKACRMKKEILQMH